MTTLEEYFGDPDRPTFLTFGKKINTALVRLCGLGVFDLADQDYSSLHEDWDETDAQIWEMARDILEEEGFDFDEEFIDPEDYRPSYHAALDADCAEHPNHHMDPYASECWDIPA
jgi:hypothetical protein